MSRIGLMKNYPSFLNEEDFPEDFHELFGLQKLPNLFLISLTHILQLPTKLLLPTICVLALLCFVIPYGAFR